MVLVDGGRTKKVGGSGVRKLALDGTVVDQPLEMGSMEANPLFHTGETAGAVSGRLQDSNRLCVPRRD